MEKVFSVTAPGLSFLEKLMLDYFRYPMPAVQALGFVTVQTDDQPDASRILPKPVAAAVLTLAQRDDGHVAIIHQMMSAAEETQLPLPWLINQALIGGGPTLVSADEAQILLVEAARQRFFAEHRLAALVTGVHAIDVAPLAGDEVSEPVLCSRLAIPRLDIDPAAANRLWAVHLHPTHAATLGQYALASAVSRLMLWANLMATRTAEPGWFYETMLALRSWLDERETDAPELYAWGTAEPIMRAASYVEDYRRDLGRRFAGLDSDWPTFETGLFHS